MTEPVALKTRIERLWDDYVSAAAKAQQSLDREDGMAAGRAWHAFVMDFAPAHAREIGEDRRA